MNLPWWAWLLIAYGLIQFPLGVLIGRRLQRHEDSEDPKPPAGGGGLSPGAAETASAPQAAVPPVGLNPHPLPRRRVEDIAARVDFIRCGCMDTYWSDERRCETATCREHTFDVANWNERLRQS